MENKPIKIYLVILISLCFLSAGIYNFLPFTKIDDTLLPIPAMVLFTFPALFCIISLLSTNGFRNFRLDLLGVVSSGIWVVVFVGLMGVSYFMIGESLRYPQYSREYTAVILSICSFIAILPLIALHDTFRKNAKQIKEHGKMPGKLWRNIQYATLASATLLVVFLLLPGDREDGYQMMFMEYGKYDPGLTGVFLLFAELSIALTIVFLLAGWLWSQAKIASVLSVLLLTPLVFLGSFVYMYTSFDPFVGSQFERYYSGRCQPDIYNNAEADITYVYDGSEEHGENYEGYGGDGASYQPEFIGDGIIGTDQSDPDTGDIDSISAATHYFAKHMSLKKEYIMVPIFLPEGLLPYLERSSGGDYTGGYGSEAYDGLVKLIWKNRKSIALESLFDMYSHLIEKAIPYEVFVDNGYQEVFWQLISVYEDLKGDPEDFRKIYNLMDESIYENNSMYDAYDRYYDLIEPYITEDTRALFFTDRKEDEEESAYQHRMSEARQRVVWVYSFWGRRHNEGIAKGTYDALYRFYFVYGA